MTLAAPRGRVVVAGVCMTEDRLRPMVGINKHLTVQFVLGYTPGEFAEALTAIGEDRIDPSPLVTRTVTLDELPEAFRALSDPKDCKVVLTFER
jgi:threonine dehydrogenase-like Zn-dependent dehydrogenase